MTRIVGVHGIGNYSYLIEHGSVHAATEAISQDWSRWLSVESAPRVTVSYYADVLHRGTAQGVDDVTLLEPEEQELLVAWVESLMGVPHTSQGPATAKVRQAAEWLTERYGTTARRLGTTFVREVATYLSPRDESFRIRARTTVAETIRANQAQVVIAHSLGSVIAYEALWAQPDPKVDLLITLGSPLGMNKVIFQRLQPGPMNDRCGRPPGVRRWINLADVGDLVALPFDLRSRFDNVEQHDPLRIHRFDFHLVRNYLHAPEVRDLVTAVVDPHGQRVLRHSAGIDGA
ncbi:hypothetical protein J5X84_32025 [Streptosporangiaceae bacterium NEAU-GS5]|nr:hypothetical protein [Streptosporangiaceae bacterium NEAU-GS5]